ncbi:unnamed protein product, partial [Owenia fusiformis]
YGSPIHHYLNVCIEHVYHPVYLNCISGAYYCFNLVMVVLSIIISMFVFNMCVRGPRRGSAPNWLKSLVHGKLGSLCCVREEMYSPLVHFEHRDDDEAQLTSNIVRNNDTDEMTDLNTNKLDKTLTEILGYLKSSNQDPSSITCAS